MKTKMKFLGYLLLMFTIAVSTISCEGEDGEDGAIGEQGPAGQDGEDGENGNANVSVKTIDGVTWTSGSFLGADASVYEISDTDITQEVVDNYLILVYFQLFNEDPWYPMTFNFPQSDGGDQVITFTYELNTITLYSLRTSGELNAAVTRVRYFLIEGNSLDMRSMTNTNSIKESLIEDGVDLKNYEEVKNYFNLKD